MSLARLGVAGLSVAAAAAVMASGVGLAGQASSARPEARPPVPLTADGHPELEGVWNFSTLTPLERPASLAGKSTFTSEEAAAFARAVIQANNADRRDGGADADVDCAYNDSWYDRGTRLAMIAGRTPTSLITDPPDGRIPPLTPDAARRGADRARQRRSHPADGPEDRSLAERCLSFNAGPPMLPAPYNNYLEIFQARDHIVLFNEMIHDARVVPVNGPPHLPPTVRQLLGDPRGRWDGGTFVVDTTNFGGGRSFRGSDDGLHLIERFTRVDRETLLYEFTIDDPTAFTRPWSAVLPMKLENTQVYEYACHEGNFSLSSILRAARLADRDAGPR